MKTAVLALALALGLSTTAQAATNPARERALDTVAYLDPENPVHLAGTLSAARVLCGEREGTTQVIISLAFMAAYEAGEEEGRGQEEVDASISRITNAVAVSIGRAEKPAFCRAFGERLP